jgi:hypothetical protein
MATCRSAGDQGGFREADPPFLFLGPSVHRPSGTLTMLGCRASCERGRSRRRGRPPVEDDGERLLRAKPHRDGEQKVLAIWRRVPVRR